MALVACKECKNEVASSAKKCPHCGVSNPGAGMKEVMAGVVVLGVIVAVTMSMCSGDSDTKGEVPKSVTTAPESMPIAPPAVPVSGTMAKSYIQDIDAAMRDGDKIAQSGDLKSLSQHSARVRALAQDGRRFGETAMDKPFGSCFGAGVHAQAAWQAIVHAATSATPVDDNSRKQYASHRSACLEAAGATP